MSLREDLKAFADGELDIQRSEEMRLALERDPILRRELTEILAISATIKASAAELTPIGLMATLEAVDKGRPRREWGYRLALGGGVLVTAGLAAALLFPIFAQAKFAAKSTRRLSSKAQFEDASKDIGIVADGVASPSAEAPLSRLKAQQNVVSGGAAAKSTGSVDLNQTPHVGRPRQKRTVVAMKETPVNGFMNGLMTGTAKAPKPVVSKEAAKSHFLARDLSGAASRIPIGGSTSPQLVTLSFPSTEAGVRQVLAVVGKYQVPSGSAMDKVTVTSDLSKARTLIVELPEETADKTIATLRELTSFRVQDWQIKAPNGIGGGGASGVATNTSASAARVGPPISSTTLSGAAVGARPGGGARDNAVAKSQNAVGESAGRQAAANSVKSTAGEAGKAEDSHGVLMKKLRAAVQRPKTRRVMIVIYELPKPKPVH